MHAGILETYIAVVDSGSMAEAARRLDLAPTTVAQQIKTLESELGVRLLSRSGRTVRPTIAGMRIVARAKEIIRSLNDLRSEASETALPAALREWNRVYTGIEIYIEPGSSMGLLSKVGSGELDAAIVVHPQFALAKTCDWLALREEELILLTPKAMKVDDPLEVIAKEPFIRYDRGVVAGKLADDYLRSRNIRPHVQFELDGIEHIAKFVSQGLGISILPDWPTLGDESVGVRRWRLPPPCPSRTVGLVWARTSVRSPLSQAMAALLKDQATASA